MAFIRVYSAQGDPRFHFSTMRAGRLVHAKILSAMRARRGSPRRRRLSLQAGDPMHMHAARRYALLAGDPFQRSMRMPAGDPFSLRVPKFLKRLKLKKIVGGLASLAGAAAPFVGLVPGIGKGLSAGLTAFGSLAPRPQQDASQYGPPFQGPPSVVAAGYGGYQVPGIEVTSTYTGARGRMSPPPEDTGDDTGDDTGEGTP